MGGMIVFQGLEKYFDRHISVQRTLDLEAALTISLTFQKDIPMRTYDFSPLYRSAIGFDRLAHLFDDAQRAESQPSYPPYNIELVSEDQYRITMAVSGFDRSEIEIETERDTLKITGRKPREEAQRNFLHRGIASRNFEHSFQLADHVRVVGAKLDNGLLNIELAREIPEALKPRKIVIDAVGENVQALKAA
jgi:molecular chaperone IbpA